MFKIERVDNLTKKNLCVSDYWSLAEEMTQLVNENIDYSNNSTYDKTSLEQLKRNKTQKHIHDLILKSFVICIYDRDKLVACGFLTKQDNRYFSKSLHVHRDFRGNGLGKIICHEREKLLKKIGVKELYIESIKFPETLKFHRHNGFKTEPLYKELKNTILMKKILR